MSEPRVLGYVLVSAGANRDPCLPHTSVTKDRADVEHERREWAKRDWPVHHLPPCRGRVATSNGRNESMAQALEAGTAILYAGTARKPTQDDDPPDVDMWNWHPVEGHVKEIVDAALAASRKAGEELVAGRRIL